MHPRKSVRAFVSALCLLSLAGAALAVAPSAGAAVANPVDRAPLSTNGSRIVDRNGAEFTIQGVNWFGFETHNHIVHGLWTRDYRDMLAQIKAQGFNTIRLPFSIQAVRSSTFDSVDFANGRNAALAGKTPLQAMDVIISEAAAKGLLILLDNHSVTDDSFSDDLWYGSGGYTEDDWVATWQMLAQRYRNQPNVIGADLKNEPHGRASWGDGGATDWRRAAERGGNAVLANAPNWLIVVEGTEGPVPGQQLPSHWWGGNLEAVGRLPVRLSKPNRIVYSPHEYGPGVYNQPWFSDPNYQAVLYDRWAKGFQYIADQGIAPILVGEFGGRQTGVDTTEGVWQRQFMDFLGKKANSWTYWAWNPNSGDTGGILQADWATVDPAKMDLLTRLINRQPISFPGSGSTGPTTTTTTVPTPPPPTTTTTVPPPPPSGAGLSLRYVTDNQWGGGYCVHLVATNSGATKVDGLNFKFTLPAVNQITSSWNGTFSRTGSTVGVVLPAWAQSLAPGARYVETGFCVQGPDRPTGLQALANGQTPPPPPPPPGSGGLTGRVNVDSQWDSGYCANVQIDNPTSRSIDPGVIKFTLGTQVGITDAWNGTVVRSSANATVTLPDWLGPIAAGGVSKDFGFCTNKAASAANLPSNISVT